VGPGFCMLDVWMFVAIAAAAAIASPVGGANRR
jgi:hypothetical protein